MPFPLQKTNTTYPKTVYKEIIMKMVRECVYKFPIFQAYVYILFYLLLFILSHHVNLFINEEIEIQQRKNESELR